jgi:hypothetical protein
MNDRIKYRDKQYGLAVFPLEEYFNNRGGTRPDFVMMQSACRRGYIAEWEVREDRLFLTGVEMVCFKDVTFDSLFPGATAQGVFADWVSGDLPCHYGKYFRRNALDFNPIPEFTLTLEVENGVVKSASDRKNEIPF